MFWRLGGQFVVVGGWLVQAQGTPQNSVFVLYAYCVLIAYYTVWDVSEVRMTHPWFESITTVVLQLLRMLCSLRVRAFNQAKAA